MSLFFTSNSAVFVVGGAKMLFAPGRRESYATELFAVQIIGPRVQIILQYQHVQTTKIVAVVFLFHCKKWQYTT